MNVPAIDDGQLLRVGNGAYQGLLRTFSIIRNELEVNDSRKCSHRIRCPAPY